MKIYIASSWKNQHGVEMLTALLRQSGHEVVSWVENNYGESHNHVTKRMDFETWVTSPESDQSFRFDTEGAMTSDLVIYYGPAGKDACAELGAAFASKVPIVGLWAKGEDLGLMRKMVNKWFERVPDLVEAVNKSTLGMKTDDCKKEVLTMFPQAGCVFENKRYMVLDRFSGMFATTKIGQSWESEDMAWKDAALNVREQKKEDAQKRAERRGESK